MKKIRVLVTDDSAFMRKVISDILQDDPEIEVIDRARNGLECLEKSKQLKPDVITLDIEMPIMNGLEALEQLMKQQPVPVVMLSSLTRDGADATIRALELGAFDFVTKPSGPISLDIHKVGDRLVERVKAAAQEQTRFKRGTLPFVQQPPVVPPSSMNTKMWVKADGPGTTFPRTGIGRNDGTKLVVLGTSTGGPKALQAVLTSLPAEFPAPIAIVQHMPAGFTKSLAQRLDSLCAIRVTEVMDGEWLESGTAYIAPGGYHFEVQQVNGRLQAKLHQQEPRGGHRPSVDILFESVSRLTKVDKWAIIMTGMGNDGTKGLKQMKDLGHVTSIIEDESSCVVFGMPRAAIQAGLADNVVPLHSIAETLCKLLH
ncbi:chemotaxis response regulator protein-glutamate methylesterase [Brevibacillus ruminantium]|uniref:Protein-glutamate methylesterase/protein-glutamine glutaminase n=1 Tax=Brevibacillus ruminantium TaxID=2950604 RepID=A0ABY4WQ04_9BACL|nr:chemotaxis response regulator protein-glutamate methylesterase [Brevibacillus ruminantium]USG67945.1 chemotaxis response regulator protein-glutamate methylesterase [Brevibacillus ruminantium]